MGEIGNAGAHRLAHVPGDGSLEILRLPCRRLGLRINLIIQALPHLLHPIVGGEVEHLQRRLTRLGRAVARDLSRRLSLGV